MTKVKLITLILLTFTFSCSTKITSVSDRIQIATNNAKKNNMYKKIVNTRFFDIVTFQKIKNLDNKTVSIYIEGDGLSWISKYKASSNPTPLNSLMLDLIKLDSEDNIVYIARPCQFHSTSRNNQSKCNIEYWTSHRFSEKVIHSINKVIDKLKYKHKFNKINLYGFSGGAALAVIIASKRQDVNQLKTIAGNLDHEQVNRNHGVSQMPNSLNAIDFSKSIKSIPQQHFIGGNDNIITEDIIFKYLNASKYPKCTEVILVKNATHETGWENIWEQKLDSKIECQKFNLH